MLRDSTEFHILSVPCSETESKVIQMNNISNEVMEIMIAIQDYIDKTENTVVIYNKLLNLI